MYSRTYNKRWEGMVGRGERKEREKGREKKRREEREGEREGKEEERGERGRGRKKREGEKEEERRREDSPHRVPFIAIIYMYFKRYTQGSKGSSQEGCG